MFKEEIKKELKNIVDYNISINDLLVDTKIALHNLDKLGFNIEELQNKLDDLEIEFYQFKMMSKDYANDKLKSIKGE